MGLTFVAFGGFAYSGILVVLYATAIGVAIDVDHLFIARKNTGDWEVLRRCMTKPKAVFFEQDTLMSPTAVPHMERLRSHVLITGALFTGLLVVNRYLAIITLLVLIAHIICDLIADAFPDKSFSPGSNG